MSPVRFVVASLAFALVACGGRAGPASGLSDGGSSSDGSGCPSPAPTEGASCSFDSTRICEYYLPGPCPGAVDNCRCMNGSWHCEVAMLDGGPCGPADAAVDGPDAAPDGPPAAFCSGATAHMVANGIESHPVVTGTMLPLNCCYAAEFVVMTETVTAPVVVSWRAQVGSSVALPATIDLAHPPEGWAVQVDVGCDPAQGGCNPAPDSYTTGLGGTLAVSLSSDGTFDMSLCLAAAEPAGSPHPVLHSLELYAPHVTAGY